MENNILLSIIIPVYNTNINYLKDCFESIIKIEKIKYEVIIVDDGSNKVIADYLDTYNNKNSNFIVYHKENSGVSKTRNFGISKAIGKYIMFVDSDDCINYKWVLNSLNLSQKYNYDIVFGRVQICDRKEINKVLNYEYDEKIFNKNELKDLQEYLMEDDISPIKYLKYIDHGQCGKLFKKEIIKNVKFEEDLKISEDQVFLHTILNNCSKCLVNNELAYYYINNQESTGKNYMENAIINEAKAMENLENLLIKDFNYNIFYYRVINDLRLAIALEIYSQKSSILTKIKEMKKIYKIEIYNKSLKEINLKIYSSKLDMIKVFLLKHKLIIIFTIFKTLSKN